jgi:predicted dehydrogenase
MDSLAGLRPVIVGYGRAGRGLHHRALSELGIGPVTVVDPREPGPPHQGVTWLPDLAALAALDRAVVHVATPPATHADVVAELLDMGATRIIVEKPLAETAARARDMVAIAQRMGASLLPVSVWPASNVTAQLTAELPGLGQLRTLTFEHDKPRQHSAVALDGHRTAFEIEMPHQLVLALYLAGPAEEVLDVGLVPIALPGVTLSWLGGAYLRLRHSSGVVSELTSSLLSERRRVVTARGAAAWLTARYPLHADDYEGELVSSGDPVPRRIPDRPLTSFIAAAYGYLGGRSPGRPAGSDLSLHLQACELIELATRQALAGRRWHPQLRPTEAV